MKIKNILTIVLNSNITLCNIQENHIDDNDKTEQKEASIKDNKDIVLEKEDNKIEDDVNQDNEDNDNEDNDNEDNESNDKSNKNKQIGDELEEQSQEDKKE
jgi:hypothetical protein